MKKLVLLLFVVLASFANSQSKDFKTFLRINKFLLIDIKYNAHSHMSDIEKGYFYYSENSYRAKMEMDAIIYDTSIVKHKKLLKNLKFSVKDTVLIFDWDPEGDAVPYYVTASRYKYSSVDSLLTFYNAQNISSHVHKKTSNPYMATRRFKLVSLENDRFILIDKDFTDVKRTYVFKKVTKKS